MHAQRVSIHSVGVIATAGVGFEQFRATLAGNAAPAPRPPSAAVCGVEPRPQAPAHWVADFDVRRHLGDKGVAALDRSTQMAIVACGEALSGAAAAADPAARTATGVVLGTMGGGMRSIADFVRSTYTAAPHMVSPMQFPNTVMNCAAGQCAIWHGLRGVNSTVCAGEMSGLAALQYASRMLRLGHARHLLAGSVEEYCDFSAWSHECLQSGDGTLMGEGTAVFFLGLMESSQAPLAELCGVRMRQLPVASDRDPAAAVIALSTEIEALLRQRGLAGSELRWWAGGASGGGALKEIERQALTRARCDMSTMSTLPPRVVQTCGRTYGASVSLCLAGVLAAAPEGLGLLTAVSEDGQVGCALVRMPDARHH